MKNKHYSKCKDGKIIEVKWTYKHKCLEKCSIVKKIRKMQHLCEDLVKELIGSLPEMK